MVETVITVLIIESDSQLGESISQMLVAYSPIGLHQYLFVPVLTPDVSSGVRYLQDNAVDVVLLDSGEQATAITAVQEQVPSVPIILLVAPGQLETISLSLETSVFDYIEKDIIDGQLLARLLFYAYERYKLQPQIEEALYRHTARLEILYKINQAILSARNSEEIAQIALRSIRDLTVAKRASVTVFDYEAGKATILASDSEAQTKVKPGTKLPLHLFIPTEKLYQGEVYIMEDLSVENFLSPTGYQLKNEGVLSFALVPLIVQDQLIGTLNVGTEKLGVFTVSNLDLLRLIANSVAVALQQMDLYQQAESRTAELEAITDISTGLRTAQSVDTSLSIILEKTTAVTGSVSGSIFLVDNENDELVARGTYPPDPNMQIRRRKRGSGITGHVAETGKIFISEDLRQDTLAHVVINEVDELQLVRSCIALPLRTQNHIVGVMHLGFPQKHTFSQAEIRLLTTIAEIAGNTLDRAMVMETLEQRVKERTRALADANERLKELDYLKSKFVSEVSHELRTPITNLNLYLDLLIQGNPNKRQEYLDIIRKQSTRLIQLIEDTLDLSRIELGESQVKFRHFYLNTLVRQVMNAHEVIANETGLALIMELQHDLPLIYGEPNQLAQVITNLLTNALNYTSEGYIRVCTKWDKGRNQIALSVEDTGIGIEAQDKHYIFERFYRGEFATQSTIPGTGLGLAIVKEIVDLHSGHIEVKSEVGTGSIFQVWLPLETNLGS